MTDGEFEIKRSWVIATGKVPESTSTPSYQMYVFGSNGEGQLGSPAAEIVSTPTIIPDWPSDRSIKALCSGDNHTLILSTTGSLTYAGNTSKGQLGFETQGAFSEKYEHFRTFEGNISLCAATCESTAYINQDLELGVIGEHSVTRTNLLTTGTCYWGELGSDLRNEHKEVHSQALPESVIDFAGGGWHYVVILSNGDVMGWGKSRLDQLGPKLSAQQSITKPTLIEEDIPFNPVKVVCGKEFTYLASEPSLGEHYLLGRDKFSLLSSMPAHIKDWKQIGATWHAMFVLFEDGTLTAWGKDNMWKLLPENLPPIEHVAVGSDHVLALTRDGKLISWGWGKHGNCGDLTKLGDKVKNDMVSGFWNEIDIPGKIEFIGAGFCTSFVLTEVPSNGVRYS